MKDFEDKENMLYIYSVTSKIARVLQRINKKHILIFIRLKI